MMAYWVCKHIVRLSAVFERTKTAGGETLLKHSLGVRQSAGNKGTPQETSAAVMQQQPILVPAPGDCGTDFLRKQLRKQL